MPRALTEGERGAQKRRLLEKGKTVVLEQGIRKVSIDDIAKAAGMAKGSFYHHFASKEEFMFHLIWHIHELLFARAEQAIRRGGDIESFLRDFLSQVFDMQETSFFLKNFQEISAVLSAIPPEEGLSAVAGEAAEYERLLTLAGIDTTRVNPGVVHNYLHVLYFVRSSDLMSPAHVGETFDHMLDGLVSYVLGGVR